MDRIEFLQKQLADLDAYCKELKAEIKKLKSVKFMHFANEDCWIYQGDGEDHLESLVCPVVISAETLIKLGG